MSKIVVLVVHGQNCVFNENCLYKAILKTIDFIFNSYLDFDEAALVTLKPVSSLQLRRTEGQA